MNCPWKYSREALRNIIVLSLLFFSSFFTSCYKKEAEETLVCARLVDGNGIAQTITSEQQLKKFTSVNFEEKQPYKKVLRIFRSPHGKQKCILTTYHPSGHLWQYLEGEDLTANGSYLEFYPNGKRKIEAEVIAGPCDISPSAQTDWKFDGRSLVYNQNGQLIAEIPYENGELHGRAIYYSPDGTQEKSITYSHDMMHGEMNEFFPNGSLKKKEVYQSNLLHGHSLGYYRGENPAYIEEYEKGSLMQGIYYHRDGSILSTITNGFGKKALFQDETLFQLQEFKRGELEGIVSTFLPSGELICEYQVKNGKKEGEEKEYYLFDEVEDASSQKTKLSITWRDGKIEGMVKTWYENGALESQREMVQNKKNGHSICWYKDGSLLCMEEYENDTLQEGKYFKKGEKEPISRVTKGEGLATLYDGRTGHFLRKIKYLHGTPQL